MRDSLGFMSLFDVAIEYASHRALSWGRMLICGRSDDGFGYRIVVNKREPVPVLSVPSLSVDETSLAVLAWLFGRHSTYMDGGVPVSSPEAWHEAENIYTDLCLLADVQPDPDAFLRQRQAMTLAS
jgi:hypothetical protein